MGSFFFLLIKKMTGDMNVCIIEILKLSRQYFCPKYVSAIIFAIYILSKQYFETIILGKNVIRSYTLIKQHSSPPSASSQRFVIYQADEFHSIVALLVS